MLRKTLGKTKSKGRGLKLFNSKGEVFYGMHFYPGTAEYKSENGNLRVYVSEETIRQMGPSFAGRPVYVQHVDDVPENMDDLKNEADGYVVESFFNEADGRHWVKFIVVSRKGLKAVQDGYRLSNCYTPVYNARSGEHNGVKYNKEVISGTYDHLALVTDPRYEESVVMTPDEFKSYNDSKRQELAKLKNEGDKSVLKFFKREKLENSKDLESTVVVLPKSGREIEISKLVNEADEAELAKTKPRLVNSTDLVKVGDEEMTVEKLVNSYLEFNDDSMHEAEDLENESDDEDLENKDDEDLENEDDEDLENEDDEDKEEEEKKENKKAKNKKTKNSKTAISGSKPEFKNPKAKALKNAKGASQDESEGFDPFGAVELGKQRYG
jgi:uncharacterized protein involved in high-affinity Fe2+ transport